jgi:hypothetical protein
MPSPDHPLLQKRPVLVTIDEAQVLTYAVGQLMLVAAKENDQDICVRLYRLHETIRSAFAPEEWEEYSNIIAEHTDPNPGES